ncbi:MAG TPA: hypothetical protein VFR67_11605 [Pilimelia sp.]|nr:hypothetical protein [Pilimelia sp.]
MTVCPRCRKENADDAIHCASCRAYLGWTRGRRGAPPAPAAGQPAAPAPPEPDPPAKSRAPQAPPAPAGARPPGPPPARPGPPPGPPPAPPGPPPVAPARASAPAARAPAPPPTAPAPAAPTPRAPWTGPEYVPGPPAGSPQTSPPPGPAAGHAAPSRVPERSIGVRVSGLPPRLAPRSPFAAPPAPGQPVQDSAAPPDLGAVQPQDTAPPPPPRDFDAGPQSDSARPQPPGAGEVACPNCGRGVGATRRFCRCGATLTPPRQRSTESTTVRRLPWYRRLGEIFGRGRDFRRAIRAANGGVRVTYDVAMATRARFVRTMLLLGMVGIGASQFGPWAPDLRAQVAQRIDRFLPHRYAPVPAESVRAEPATRGLPGFDLNYAVDGNPERAWAAPWTPPAAQGQSCNRPGGAPALLVTFRTPGDIERVVIRGGLAEGNDKRALQHRPRRLDIRFSDGTCQVAELDDKAGPQTIGVKAAAATHARVVIVDAYPPSDAGDGLVSISEIGFEVRR